MASDRVDDSMLVDLTGDDEKELRDMGMDDEDVVMVRESISVRRQPRGEGRQSYSVAASRLSQLTYLVSDRNPHFERQVGFAYVVFADQIVKPLRVEALKRKEDGVKGWTRKTQIIFEHRVYRMMLYLRGEMNETMFSIFDQHPTTCIRDAEKLVDLAFEVLVPIWVDMPAKGSPEYMEIRGSGVFSADFPNAVYAGDMTHIPIKKPTRCEKAFYNGNKKVHALMMVSLADGHGYTRYVSGPFSGSTRDPVAIARAKLTKRLADHYIERGDVVLYDKGLGSGLQDGLWLAPVGGYFQPARDLRNRVRDLEIRRARAIVEQSYRRIKGKFPILSVWRKRHHKLHKTFTLCCALVNIHIATGHPLHHTCLDDCELCELIE